MKAPMGFLFLPFCLLLLLTSAGCAFGARKIALLVNRRLVEHAED